MKTDYPAGQTPTERKAKIIKYPNMFDSKAASVGDSVDTEMVKVEVRDQSTGKLYGVRTITQKVVETDMSLIRELLEQTDFGALPDRTIAEIQKLIRQGAKDLAQLWKGADELVRTAYHVAQTEVPSPNQRAAWAQYIKMIQYGVRQLSKHRGIDGEWRSTKPNVSNVMEVADQAIDDTQHSHKFYIEVPNSDNIEVEATSIDDVMKNIREQIKEKRPTSRLKIVQRSDDMVVAMVVNDDMEQYKILIKRAIN